MKNNQLITKVFIYSIVYLLLYNLPLVSFRHHGLYNLNSLAEVTILIPALFVVFGVLFLFLPRFLAILLIIALFFVGGGSLYYLIEFGKTLDVGVIIDFLSVEAELSADYFTWVLGLFLLVSLIIPVMIEVVFSKCKVLNANKFVIVIQLLCISFFCLYDLSNKIQYKATVLLDHPPFKHNHVTFQFLTKYSSYKSSNNAKKDLTTGNKVELKSHHPLTVVLIIGESMRGDINALNGYEQHDNMPMMSQVKNLVSFSKASASATSTRLALPYMLTNAVPPDFEAATTTLGVTSIFKSLGFKTSWIGNQGMFGYYDVTYASNALESDYVVSNHEMRVHLNQRFVYDENLLPYIKERLEKAGNNNNFMVIHLIGSHWHFENRYPKTFGHKFMPICSSSAVSECSQEEVVNSYNNTIIYTDYVLSLIFNELQEKNALVVYASDHGFSLNENGIFGNAYSGENVPKEQLSIEMFAWMSPEFVKNHKVEYNKMVKHKNKPVSHDYIFHSLLDCAGVKADFIDPTLSVCR